MHIGIDASRYSNLNTKTGVEWYSHHLIPGLVAKALHHNHPVTLYTPHLLSEFPEEIQCVLPGRRLWSIGTLSRHFIHARNHPDRFFVPSHILPPITPPNSITTIHDIAFRYHPEYYAPKERLLLEYSVRQARRHARQIITVSESTKRDLIDQYHIASERISVIPLGYQARTQTYTPEIKNNIYSTYGVTPQKYFVFLGRIEHKKNIRRIIEAFTTASLPQDYTLVLIGKLGYGGEEIKELYKHNPRIIHTGYLDDTKTGVLLAGATALTIPSLYEGFCMPILEAYDQGIPVLTSNHSSMPEVAGTGALLVDAKDTTAITSAMEQLASDSTLRATLVANGQKHLQAFTWERTINETFSCLIQE